MIKAEHELVADGSAFSNSVLSDPPLLCD
jgi:hypothetical protein